MLPPRWRARRDDGGGGLIHWLVALALGGGGRGKAPLVGRGGGECPKGEPSPLYKDRLSYERTVHLQPLFAKIHNSSCVFPGALPRSLPERRIAPYAGSVGVFALAEGPAFTLGLLAPFCRLTATVKATKTALRCSRPRETGGT